MPYLDKQTTEDAKLISEAPVTEDNPNSCFYSTLPRIVSCCYAFFCKPPCDEAPSETVKASIDVWRMFP